MDLKDIIVKTEGTLSGRARISGTRIGVSDVWLAYLRAASPRRIEERAIADILDNFPHLTEDQIQVALHYARSHFDEIEQELKERPPFDVLLVPGWNLISIPAEPAASAINTVIAKTHPIDTVLAYDAPTGTWLVATRDTATGLLKGTLTTITSKWALWVHTIGFDKLAVTLTTRDVGRMLPPIIKLKAGWNLVPAVFLDPYASPATTLGTYLAGTGFVRIYTYSTTTDCFVAKAAGDALTAGVGYLVYVPKDVDLVP